MEPIKSEMVSYFVRDDKQHYSLFGQCCIINVAKANLTKCSISNHLLTGYFKELFKNFEKFFMRND